ncbi:hypothetical protein SDC9_210174 [bioreactor metagenome]|uniref:Uncharacterized protein n=1 Tax=bioreactor metagenome TaxID=1076179 RepID=A0A645JG43_9ZZZZ
MSIAETDGMHMTPVIPQMAFCLRAKRVVYHNQAQLGFLYKDEDTLSEFSICHISRRNPDTLRRHSREKALLKEFQYLIYERHDYIHLLYHARL